MVPDFSSVQKVLSGRWTLNVLLAAESGGRFGEIQGRMGPIARGTLSKELQALTELELITKTVYSEFPASGGVSADRAGEVSYSPSPSSGFRSFSLLCRSFPGAMPSTLVNARYMVARLQ